MNDRPLPNPPTPVTPTDPACEWCGERPAEKYEVAPPTLSNVKKQRDGKSVTVKVLKKAATMAYACARHRELFDRRKAEAAKRADDERAQRKEAKKGGAGWRSPAI